MRTVGIKLADGSFYPIMEEGSAQTKKLELTTANDNQTCVMVDLYRSKTCSMDDAEYIDTLKIENLNAHQNGEPSISFDVGLDENGELSASIADPETGATSNSQITLVSRTAEERLVTDDFAVEEPAIADETSVEEPVVEEEPVAEEASDNSGAVAAGVVAGAGLLAAAGIIAANKNKDEEPEEAPAEESVADFDADETITEDDFTLGDDTIGTEEVVEEPADDASGLVADDTTLADDSLPDMDFDIPEETAEPVEEPAAEEPIADEPIADDATVVQEEPLADEDFDLGDDFDAPADEASGFIADDATITDDATIADDTTIAEDDSFDLPDDTTEATDEDATFASDDSFDLPDDTTEASDDTFDLPDDSTIPGDETILEDESFSTPQELTDNSADETDDFFNDIDSEPTPSPSEGLNFTGLYDKETEMGEPSAHEEDDIKKKTRAPVIICVVCAIICIVATILVLLVVPGKFNLRQKHADKKAQTAVEKQAETPSQETAKPAEEKKPDPVPQAKENEVVVIEKAEEVKPLPPPAAETKSKDVSYKIKWGDTLWDIADTYYKNPWRYKKIAKYNNIKNPDHIISGTVIQIPAE